ncbi:hypothetical protein [Bradyrhizobium sp. Arg816]|nr:hypothetical protein [Bradyrhizobium sp. Arg816]MDI3561082.1 hypothetical protein [Bradyrhizobium sp. Arg816]
MARKPSATCGEIKIDRSFCSQMQGWLFSPAVPAAKLRQLLSAQAAAA